MYGIATLPAYEKALAEKEAAEEAGESPPDLPLPCDVVAGPTLYSIVKYDVTHNDITKTIQYPNNKLPRTLSVFFNPAALIHGNIFSSEAFSPTASHSIQKTGNVAIDIVRNTIDENIKKYLRDIKITGKGKCLIRRLNTVDDLTVSGCSKGADYETFTIDDENVVYFRESQVTLALDESGDNSIWNNKWAIIVDGGRLIIDEDIYHEDLGSRSLALVVLRPYDGSCETSNIYINSEVTNVDANMVSDCSIFRYHPTEAKIGADGLPEWTNEKMQEFLNSQFYERGSIASRNTLGGADLDAEGKEYLLLGTGEVFQLPVTPEERLIAQIYDVNYWGFLTYNVEIINGFPLDQRCGRVLTIDDMIQIKEGGDAIYGEKTHEDGDPIVCDGIDLEPYDSDTLYGDLVVPADNQDALAKGLDPEEDFDPVIIQYIPADSFVFEKGEEVGTR
jgi:hypothetical protein